MRVIIPGSGNKEVNLTKSDLLAQGGEGQVFVKNHTAFKVYFDHNKSIPEAKIKELAALKTGKVSDNAYIIKPNHVLFDSKRNNIGYTMKYVPNTVALCKAFTKAFKTNNNITPQDTVALVQELQSIVEYCHKHNILIVDLNELNFMINESATKIYAIDVDSYQTPHFPATAIMENIRDRKVKNNKWTEESDWFSFAILSFNLFIGIHPYKGKHPTIKSWEDRMDKNISIFDNKVKLPGVCLPLTVIPDPYLSWYKGIFINGNRNAPPADPNAPIQAILVTKSVSGTNLFDIKELESLPSDIVDVIYGSTKAILTAKDGLFVNSKQVKNIPAKAKVITLPNSNVIAGYIDNNNVKVINVSNGRTIPISINASHLMKYDNRLYAKCDTSVFEIKLNSFGANVIASTIHTANVLEYGTQVFDGVMFQNLLGATYASFFPNSGEHYQVNIKELDNKKIIDAKFEKGVLMIITNNKGKYYKHTVKISSDFQQYSFDTANDIHYTGINFTVLDNGICAHIDENEQLLLFSYKHTQNQSKSVSDNVLDHDMKLTSYGTNTLFYKANKLYSIRMK